MPRRMLATDSDTPTEERITSPRIGRVVSFCRGEVRVDFEGNRRGPLLARVSAGLQASALERGALEGHEGVLLFEDGNPARPVLLSLLRSATPLIDGLLATPSSPMPRRGRLDGERVDIEGHEEIVIRCGKSSLTLRRDGQIILRGVNVTSHADLVHKLRGGKVQVN